MRSYKIVIYLLLVTASNTTAQITTVPFEYYQRLIFVRVNVNSAYNLLFLLDTGANVSAIDQKIAETLHLEEIKIESVEGSAGTISVPTVKSNSVSVGQAELSDINFTKYNLKGSLSPPNENLDGILGTDFLKHFIVTLDFKKRLITLSNKCSDYLSESIPFELENGIPRFKSIINFEISSFFRYDSGSSLFETDDIYLNTTSNVFEMISKIDTSLKPVANFSASGIGGSMDIPVYMIKSISLNNYDLTDPFIIVQPKQGYFARQDAVGFFGNNLVEKFEKVTIDFKNKIMYVLKIK